MSFIATKGRIAAIDIARGIALVAMAIYHFTWDLEFFGWVLPGTSRQIGWLLFARAIASSFLILVGISLVLAHSEGIRWNGFWKRLAMVAAAAAAISLVTWFAVPDSFIFFGILHAIALFSLIAVFTVRLPWWINGVLALAVLMLSEALRSEALGAPWLYWLGLAPVNPASNDYVPLFPWFSATLLGVAIGQFAKIRGWFERIKGRFNGNRADRSLGFIGRHSLAFYLIHQPVLIGLIWLFTQVIGPPDQSVAFTTNCERTCVSNNDAAFCERFCSCMLDEMKSEQIFTPFLEGKIDLETDEKGSDVLRYCSAR
ncbi:DUF1624 domain-containing protein [Pseudahrensia aquimaris]|uniref:DUF1624 domain-containing protein n=1 Tax=Pseudahrensia aquimaris TaxID=744461 RepID=A0ABW3FGM9_9HYPH